MRRPVLHLDVETRSTVDLKKTGMYVYAESPDTDVWVACWAIDDSEVQVWLPGDPPPFALKRHVAKGYPIFAHNAMFEKNIWDQILTPRYGWPVPQLEQFYCTASMAAAMALPRDLQRACMAAGLDVQKDMDGHRLMMQMARPRSKDHATGELTWWNLPEKIERLVQYCKTDVEAERALEKKLRPLNPTEREVWLLDCRINQRGIHIDSKNVESARVIAAAMKTRFEKELARLTNYHVTSYNQHANFLNWVRKKGVDTNSLDKSALVYLLSLELDPTVRRALEIRREGAKSSTAKINAYRQRVCRDGRMRENLMYHGASTGRWAGKGAQPQNMPDPARVGVSSSTIEKAFELLPERDVDSLEFICGEPMTVLSCCMRGMMTGGPGKLLVSADYSNIEGRVLAWLSGHEEKLDAFRKFDAGKGPDLYKVAAGSIYVKAPDEIDKLERQVGKVSELACGYQGGVNAFHTMATSYQVDMSVAYPNLWARQSIDEQELLEDRYKNYVNAKNKDELDLNDPEYEELEILSREVWMASEITKQLWRKANAPITQWWYDLEDAALEATRNHGRKVPCRRVVFLWHGNVLWCRLPSGRCLAYMDAKEKTVKTPWGADKQTVTYMGVNSYTRKWCRQKAYGGLWAENITQAVARDILAEAMLRIDPEYPVVLSVHDELVSEIDAPESLEEQQRILKDYEREMAVLPDWAEGLPVTTEGWIGKRYQK